jgi:acetate kinase
VSGSDDRVILALNPGSSSLKAAVRCPELVLSVSVDRIGSSEGTLTVSGVAGGASERAFDGGVAEAVDAIGTELGARGLVPGAVSHRVVHGGPDHYRPSLIDEALLADLRAAIPLAPLHLPGELDSIGHARRVWPNVAQVACFDTAFHHDLPEVARRLPVAEELAALGVRRYGFHGLSVQSVVSTVPDLGQAVVAHLGSGCSATAVADGKPRQTSMSLTPTGGMISGTRSGDLDPEIVLFLIQEHGYTVDHLRELLDRGSGIAGVAGGRHDLRDLVGVTDDHALLALEMFVHSAAAAIAVCATTLDRWETLVFTGGVGEHSAPVRDRIIERLTAIRPPGLRALVVPADEQAVLDDLARAFLAAPSG